MSRITKGLKSYFVGSDYNIFRNVTDALFGSFVLVFSPLASLISVIILKDITWVSYYYPLVVICVSGIYDSIGRLGEKYEVKNRKLWVRIVIYTITAIGAIFIIIFYKILSWLPPLILIFDCMSLLFETVLRVYYSVQLRKTKRRKKK